jgi:hypothetical protein
MTQVKNTALRNTKAPNLLIAPVAYSQAYLDQLLNALRLYFNQIDNFTLGVQIPSSGITEDRPTNGLRNGLFYFDTTLGIPIWWYDGNWVDATGATV